MDHQCPVCVWCSSVARFKIWGFHRLRGKLARWAIELLHVPTAATLRWMHASLLSVSVVFKCWCQNILGTTFFIFLNMLHTCVSSQAYSLICCLIADLEFSQNLHKYDKKMTSEWLYGYFGSASESLDHLLHSAFIFREKTVQRRGCDHTHVNCLTSNLKWVFFYCGNLVSFPSDQHK